MYDEVNIPYGGETMSKSLKNVLGWLAILPLGYLTMGILIAVINAGDNSQQMFLAGIIFLALLIWYVKYSIEKKLEKLLVQKEK